jgi:hypothetical protein
MLDPLDTEVLLLEPDEEPFSLEFLLPSGVVAMLEPRESTASAPSPA